MPHHKQERTKDTHHKQAPHGHAATQGKGQPQQEQPKTQQAPQTQHQKTKKSHQRHNVAKAKATSKAKQPRPDTTKEQTTAEPQIIKFAADASKVFNLSLPTADMLPQIPHAEMALPAIHAIKQKFNTTVQQEPELTEFFSHLMLKHYECIKEQGWVSRNPNLICLDFATTALMVSLSYIQGSIDFDEIIDNANQKADYKLMWQTLLPLTVQLKQPYIEQLLLTNWLLVSQSLRSQFEWPAEYPATTQEVLTAFTQLLSNLYYFQAWFHGTRLEYKRPNIQEVDDGLHWTFTSPRFDTVMLGAPELSYITRIPPATEEQPWTGFVRMVDCTNMRDMSYLFSDCVTNEGEGMQLIIDALKENGQDISHVLFFIHGAEGADQITKTIVEAGSNYLILAHNDDITEDGQKPTVQTLRSQYYYYECRHAFSSLKELTAFTSLPLEKFTGIESDEFTFITSLDLTVDDNAAKVVCALDESTGALALTDTVDMLAEHEYDFAYCAVDSEMLIGADVLNETLCYFVLEQLRHNPEELAYVQAALKERGITHKVKLQYNFFVEDMLVEHCDLFLHFLGKFMYPLLKQIKEPQ